jgi:hypothetical protein
MNSASNFFSFPLAPRGNGSQFSFPDISLEGMNDTPQGGDAGQGQGGSGDGGQGGQGAGQGQGGAGGSQQGGGGAGQGSQQGAQGGGAGGQQGGQQGNDNGQGGTGTFPQQGNQPQQGQGAGQGQQQGQGGQNANQGGQQGQGQQGQGAQGQQGNQPQGQGQQGQGGAGGTDVALTDEARLAIHNEAVTALQPFISKGIFLPDEAKDYDLSSDAGMEELMRDSALGHLRHMVSELPDAAREFFLAAVNGASREEIRQMAMMDVHLPDYNQYDLTKPDHVDAILRATASAQLGEGASSDAIDALLTQYKALPDTVKASIAENGKKTLIANVNNQRAEITRTAAARQETERKQAAEQQVLDVNLIRKTGNIAGFPLSQADQEALIKFRYERNADGHTARDLALTPENRLASDYFLMKQFDTTKLAGKPAAAIAGWLKLTGNKGGGGAGAAGSSGVASGDQAANIDQALQSLGTHSYGVMPSRPGLGG